MLVGMLVAVLVASWIYWLVAWWSLRAFIRSRPSPPSEFTPPVSILKPTKGVDPQAYQNFASFCRQDYPDYEVLFGVADPADPVIEVVEQVRRDFPSRCIRVLVLPAAGMNRKASLLHALAGRARHDVLVASDSDMRVEPDYLTRVVAPLADPRVGLVTCLFRGEAPVTLTARLEALYMGAIFLPCALVARTLLGLPVAFGSTVALRRGDLARLGGFAALTDYLVDDYQLGERVAGLGLTVHLSDYLVDCVLGSTTFREQWDRMVRWMHCIRVSRPREYPGLLLTFSTALASLLTLATGFAASAWLALAVSLALRWLVGWLVTGYTLRRAARRWLVWLPLMDLLTALAWGTGLVGRRVVWRGETFTLSHDGRLVPLAAEELGTAGALLPLRPLVRRLDAYLRRTYHVFEFSHSRDCLFRLALGQSEEEVILSDGTIVRRGELVGELHLWNEHIPPLGDRRSDLAWAITFRRQLGQSLREVAAYIRTDPRFERVQAFRGEEAFGSRYAPVRLARMAERWGFDLVRRDGAARWWRRSGDFWENLYATWLIWAYNPASLHESRTWQFRRDQLWISRETLCRRYGAAAAASAAGRKVRRTSSPRTQAGLAEDAPQTVPQGL